MERFERAGRQPRNRRFGGISGSGHLCGGADVAVNHAHHARARRRGPRHPPGRPSRSPGRAAPSGSGQALEPRIEADELEAGQERVDRLALRDQAQVAVDGRFPPGPGSRGSRRRRRTGRRSPASRWRIVDLPAPFGPRRPVTPGPSTNEMSLTATTLPYQRDTPRSSTAAPGGELARAGAWPAAEATAGPQSGASERWLMRRSSGSAGRGWHSSPARSRSEAMSPSETGRSVIGQIPADGPHAEEPGICGIEHRAEVEQHHVAGGRPRARARGSRRRGSRAREDAEDGDRRIRPTRDEGRDHERHARRGHGRHDGGTEDRRPVARLTAERPEHVRREQHGPDGEDDVRQEQARTAEPVPPAWPARSPPGGAPARSRG